MRRAMSRRWCGRFSEGGGHSKTRRIKPFWGLGGPGTLDRGALIWLVHALTAQVARPGGDQAPRGLKSAPRWRPGFAKMWKPTRANGGLRARTDGTVARRAALRATGRAPPECRQRGRARP